MSIEFGNVGDTPPVAPPVPEAAVPGAPTPEAPALSEEATRLQELMELSGTFGGDFTEFSSVEDARRAALILTQGLAQYGGQQAPQGHHAPQGQQAPPAEPPKSAFSDEDFEDVDPKLVAALRRLENDLTSARSESQQFKQQLEQQRSQAAEHEGRALLNRANTIIDSFADARYGVGQGQSFTQSIARENLLRTADRIVGGLASSGRPVPPIENVIRMAVLAETGKLPQAAAPKGPAAPAAPRPAGARGAATPPAPATFGRRRTGDPVDAYMADQEFMAGARAILNRGR